MNKDTNKIERKKNITGYFIVRRVVIYGRAFVIYKTGTTILDHSTGLYRILH